MVEGMVAVEEGGAWVTAKVCHLPTLTTTTHIPTNEPMSRATGLVGAFLLVLVLFLYTTTRKQVMQLGVLW